MEYGDGELEYKMIITRRVIYEFGEVPVQVNEAPVVPVFNLVKETGGKEVSKWINWLFEKAERHNDPSYDKKYVTVVLWETGMGSYCYWYGM